MAVLASADRKQASYDFVYIDVETSLAITKPEVRAAVDAVDQWIEDNKVSYNNALPTAAKNNLTAKQKSKLLRIVLRKRWQKTA